MKQLSFMSFKHGYGMTHTRIYTVPTTNSSINIFQDVIWQGEIAGVDAALGTFRANIAYPMSTLNKVNGYLP